MTKKYAAVYQPLVERIQAESEKGHKKGPSSAKATKTKLHQLYGAYTQDNAHKKAAAIISALEESCAHIIRAGDDKAGAAVSLLSLHASTKERLPHYARFYNFILSHTGPVESILDIGCGYNPFSVPRLLDALASAAEVACLDTGEPAQAGRMAVSPCLFGLKAYHAYDIDTRVADLINRFLVCMSLPPLAQCADLAVHIPTQQADLALMCKLIPVLEAQAPGSGYRLARELNVRHLLITYPLKSLGGREKGMTKHYAARFEQAMESGELGKFELTAQCRTGTEMLYLLEAATPVSQTDS